MPAQYALHLSCEALLTDPEDKAQCTAKWGWWWNGVQIEVRKDQQWYFSQPYPYPLSRSITILISRRRARVSERMRTRKRWAREGREKGEAGIRCGPFTREWGKRKIEINRLHETHTHTHVCICACIIWEIANRTRQWSRLRRSEGIATATTDPNSPELRFTLTAWGPTARLKTSRGIFVNYARQSSLHTHTHMHASSLRPNL